MALIEHAEHALIQINSGISHRISNISTNSGDAGVAGSLERTRAGEYTTSRHSGLPKYRNRGRKQKHNHSVHMNPSKQPLANRSFPAVTQRSMNGSGMSSGCRRTAPSRNSAPASTAALCTDFMIGDVVDRFI